MDSPKPFIAALSYSGGVQSTLLLERVLRGEVEKPFRFVVLNADPGMEDSRSYWSVRQYRARCHEKGIDIITATGPNLYLDIVNSIFTGQRRIDNPPFWTKNEDGSVGRLRQKCTQFYKIAVMDRALRKYMGEKYGVSDKTKQIRAGLVEKWIGFAHDEWHRCSESDVVYITLRFPLVEDKITKSDCLTKFAQWGIEPPCRSVCVACFANGLDHFRDMYEHRPDDWAKAVEVDNAVEQWKRLGITEQEVFVSRSLIRLRELPALGFGQADPELEEMHCNSGVCFI